MAVVEAAPVVGVVMGSSSDWPTMSRAVGILEQFELWDEQVRITQVVTNADGVETLSFGPVDQYAAQADALCEFVGRSPHRCGSCHEIRIGGRAFTRPLGDDGLDRAVCHRRVPLR